MADRVSRDKRSEMMSKVKGKDTKPEHAVRSFLHRRGYRFRLQRSDLPGKPDLVLPKYGAAIFVHGCFWHRHEGCKRVTLPKSNTEFWKEKFARTIERDRQAVRALREDGWRVLVLWECEIKRGEHEKKLLDFLRQ